LRAKPLAQTPAKLRSAAFWIFSVLSLRSTLLMLPLSTALYGKAVKLYRLLPPGFLAGGLFYAMLNLRKSRRYLRKSSRCLCKHIVRRRREQLSTAQNMIENSLAVGFMFKNLVQRSDTLTAISPEPRILVDVSVLRKKDAFVFRGMKDFERYISEKNPFEKG